jgi:hypothetical protein
MTVFWMDSVIGLLSGCCCPVQGMPCLQVGVVDCVLDGQCDWAVEWMLLP